MSDDRFDWAGSPPGEAPDPPPAARRSGRAAWAGAGLVVALAAAGAIVLATSGGPAPVSLSNNAVARAADVTAGAPGYRFSTTMAFAAAGQSLSVQASGSATVRPRQLMSMSMALAGQTVQAVTAPPWEYVEAGGRWFKLNSDAYQQAIGAGGASPASSDPSELLRFLRATGTVTAVGSETIGGVSTTHYHAVTDLDRYAATVPASERQAATTAISSLEHEAGVTTIPIDAWVDAQHRVRQVVLTISGICPSSANASVTLTMNFFDYGPQPAPAIPANAVDLTSQAVAGSTLTPAQGQQSVCGG